MGTGLQTYITNDPTYVENGYTAYFDDGDAAYATLNVNSFADRLAFTKPAASADYDAEDAESRMARRRVRELLC